MPTFYVTLEETVTYEVEVEADDTHDAQDKAIALWNASSDPSNDFGGDGHGVEAIGIEQADEDEDETVEG